MALIWKRTTRRNIWVTFKASFCSGLATKVSGILIWFSILQVLALAADTKDVGL